MRKATIRPGLFLLLAWLPFPATGSAQAPSVELQAPRAFGYFTGDLVALDAMITAPRDGRLSPASLPHPRNIRPWLDLREVKLEEDPPETERSRYRLRLTYQLLDAPLDAIQRTIPSLAVKIEGPGGLTDAVVPEWTLVMSPLRGAQPGATGSPSVLMADALPQRADLSLHAWPMLAALLGAIACAGLLAWQYAWWPFHRHPARPFTAAWRHIAGRLAPIHGDNDYRESLLALHRAFDAAAGRRLFAADVDGFLEAHPQFRSARREIAEFFAASRRAFFADDIAGARSQQPIAAVSALSCKLSRLERLGV